MTAPPIRAGGRKLTLVLSIASQAMSLVRNVMVARILGPREFGLAAIIILTIAFLDSLSNAGPQNLLVQAKDEDERPLLAAAHGVTLGRGLISAALLLALGAPLSALFGVELDWLAIAGLAIASLLGGFLHRGARMVQRHGDFRPEAISQAAGEFAALAAAIGTALWLRTHLAIVAALIARSLVTSLCSHLLAPQKYELSWAKAYLNRFWTFGWPLLINGPLMFVSAQADRLFISRTEGAAALGVYSAVMVLASSPSNAILKWLGTIYMPPLARLYHRTGTLQPTGPVYTYTAAMLVVAWSMLCGFAYLGGYAVNLLYGAKFSTTAELVCLIAALQVFRFLRAWPSTLALSVAASGGILLSTTVRLMALPIGLAGLAWLGGLRGLVIGFIVGELMAFLVSLLVVNRKAARNLWSGVPAVGALSAGALGLVATSEALSRSPPIAAAAVAVILGAGCAALLLVLSPAETIVRLATVRQRLQRLGVAAPSP